MSNDYGFTVSHWTRDWQDEPKDGWSVSLPHQCDAWLIAEEEPWIDAMASLRAFIVEAEEAFVRLQDRQPDKLNDDADFSY